MQTRTIRFSEFSKAKFIPEKKSNRLFVKSEILCELYQFNYVTRN